MMLLSILGLNQTFAHGVWLRMSEVPPERTSLHRISRSTSLKDKVSLCCCGDHDEAHVFVDMSHTEKVHKLNRGSSWVPLSNVAQACPSVQAMPSPPNPPYLAAPRRRHVNDFEVSGFLLHQVNLVNSLL